MTAADFESIAEKIAPCCSACYHDEHEHVDADVAAGGPSPPLNSPSLGTSTCIHACMYMHVA